MSKADLMAKKRRNRLVIRTVVLILLASAVIYTIATRNNVPVLKVGDSAPDFELVDLDGNVQRLSDYKGEGVFLNFWGTWCPPCKKEMPHMEKLHNEFGGDGVNILTINIKDTELNVKNFRDQYELTFPIARDKTEIVKDLYTFTPLPSTFLINKDGKIEQIISRGMDEDEMRSLMKGIQTE